MAGAASKTHAGSSDGDATVELLSEIVTWSVLVWSERQRGMKNRVCDGLVYIKGAADGLLCARDRRTSRCDCYGGPCLSGKVDFTCEAVDDAVQVCVAGFGFRNMSRRVGQTPRVA